MHTYAYGMYVQYVYTHIHKHLHTNIYIICMYMRVYAHAYNGSFSEAALKGFHLIPTTRSLAVEAVYGLEVMDCAGGSVPSAAHSSVNRCLRITLKKHNISVVQRGL